MIALLASLLLFPMEEAESVLSLLEKIRPTNPKEVRIQAFKDLEKTPPKYPEQVCKILKQYLSDKDPDIRSEALVSLGLVAFEAKLECPLAIVEAIDDADEGTRDNTQGLVLLFEKYPKAAGPLIFEAADSKEPEIREFAALALPHVVGKTPEVKEKLKEMLDDPHEFVSYHAHVGLYKATGDFKGYATYLLGYTSDVNPPHPTETDAQKADETRRNLIRMAAGNFFHEATRERPKDLNEVLLGNLSHKEAAVRQAALRQMHAMAIASQESYQTIPKAKAQAEIQKLFDDENVKVQASAYLTRNRLEEGPPPEAPKKLEPLNNHSDFRERNSELEPKPGEGDMP